MTTGGLPISPIFSPDTMQVVSGYGFTVALGLSAGGFVWLVMPGISMPGILPVSPAWTSADLPASNASVAIVSNVLFIFYFLDEFVFVFPPAQLHPVLDCAGEIFTMWRCRCVLKIIYYQ